MTKQREKAYFHAEAVEMSLSAAHLHHCEESLQATCAPVSPVSPRREIGKHQRRQQTHMLDNMQSVLRRGTNKSVGGTRSMLAS